MTEKQSIIVTGGAGYIGSHAVHALDAAGYRSVIVDNLSRGHKEFCDGFDLDQIDVLDTEALIGVFERVQPAAVMHFAAFIEVGESVQYPEKYFKNNVEGVRSVLTAMNKTGVEHIVFSSTAAVYGDAQGDQALDENMPLKPINPYGESKLRAEELIRAQENIHSVCLRYFNAAGADDCGKIGEAHFPETHLIPLVVHAAMGLRDSISIYGDDYLTQDGSCVRDYIHVADLAQAHVLALEYLLDGGKSDAFNLGTSDGYSVKQIIDGLRDIAGRDIPTQIADRRAGDPAVLIANASKAQKILEWTPEKDLKTILQSAYQWHQSGLYRRLYGEHHET